jgi:hypothetical protein
MPSPFHQKYSSQSHKIFGDNSAVPAMPEAPKEDAQRRGSDSSMTEPSSPDGRRRVCSLLSPFWFRDIRSVLITSSRLPPNDSATSRCSSDLATQQALRGVHHSTTRMESQVSWEPCGTSKINTRRTCYSCPDALQLHPWPFRRKSPISTKGFGASRYYHPTRLGREVAIQNDHLNL